LEPQKAHSTTIVAKNRAHTLLCLASRFAIMVSEADQILNFGSFCRTVYPAICKCFLVFNAIFRIRLTSTIS